jgi:hypothetical protein
MKHERLRVTCVVQKHTFIITLQQFICRYFLMLMHCTELYGLVCGLKAHLQLC